MKSWEAGRGKAPSKHYWCWGSLQQKGKWHLKARSRQKPPGRCSGRDNLSKQLVLSIAGGEEDRGRAQAARAALLHFPGCSLRCRQQGWGEERGPTSRGSAVALLDTKG